MIDENTLTADNHLSDKVFEELKLVYAQLLKEYYAYHTNVRSTPQDAQNAFAYITQFEEAEPDLFQSFQKELLDKLVSFGILDDYKNTDILSAFYNNFNVTEDSTIVNWQPNEIKSKNGVCGEFSFLDNSINVYGHPNHIFLIIQSLAYNANLTEEICTYIHEKTHQYFSANNRYVGRKHYRNIMLILFFLIPPLNLLLLYQLVFNLKRNLIHSTIDETICHRAIDFTSDIYTLSEYLIGSSAYKNIKDYALVKATIGAFDRLQALDLNLQDITEIMYAADDHYDPNTQSFTNVELAITSRLKKLGIDHTSLERLVEMKKIRRRIAYLQASIYCDKLIKNLSMLLPQVQSGDN